MAKHAKGLVAEQVVRTIINSSPPGRFVERSEVDGNYYTIHPLRAITQSTQSLRERKNGRPAESFLASCRAAGVAVDEDRRDEVRSVISSVVAAVTPNAAPPNFEAKIAPFVPPRKRSSAEASSKSGRKRLPLKAKRRRRKKKEEEEADYYYNDAKHAPSYVLRPEPTFLSKDEAALTAVDVVNEYLGTDGTPYAGVPVEGGYEAHLTQGRSRRRGDTAFRRYPKLRLVHDLVECARSKLGQAGGGGEASNRDLQQILEKDFDRRWNEVDPGKHYSFWEFCRIFIDNQGQVPIPSSAAEAEAAAAVVSPGKIAHRLLLDWGAGNDGAGKEKDDKTGTKVEETAQAHSELKADASPLEATSEQTEHKLRVSVDPRERYVEDECSFCYNGNEGNFEGKRYDRDLTRYFDSQSPERGYESDSCDDGRFGDDSYCNVDAETFEGRGHYQVPSRHNSCSRISSSDRNYEGARHHQELTRHVHGGIGDDFYDDVEVDIRKI